MAWIRRTLKWTWESWGNLVWFGGLAVTFALPAWATRATGVMSEWSPLSWIVAGFLGMGFGVSTLAIGAWAKGKLVRAKYDEKLLAQGGEIDPLEKIFERKRIYLNEFCLPSYPYIDDKTFIDCEIIGPANVIMLFGNSVNEQRQPFCDGMVIAPGADPTNGYGFRNCIFRGCSFQRVTLMFTVEEYQKSRHIDWIRWTSVLPDQIEGAQPLTIEKGEDDDEG